MSRFLFVLFVLLIASGCFDNDPDPGSGDGIVIITPEPRPETCPALSDRPAGAIRVATWNIEWLNDQPDVGNVPRTPQDYDRLAFYVQCLDADIIALQEVDGPTAAQRIFDPAIYDFHFGQGGGAQQVGFAYRKSLRQQNIKAQPMPDYADLSLGGSLRPGALLQLQWANRELLLMSIHLKARCADNQVPLFESTNRDCRRLAQQVPILEAWIDEIAQENRPFIILGDFNRRFEIPDAFWPEIDDGNPRNADLTRTTEGRQGTCWPGRRERTFIDHIVYDQLANQLVIANTIWQHRYLPEHQNYDNVLSDHCPLSVDLQLGN